MLCNPDAYLVITHGPDGDYWESDANGNANFTAAGMQFLNDLLQKKVDCVFFLPSTGEKLVLWNTPWIISNGAETSYKDGKGNFRICQTQQWEERMQLYNVNPTFEAWQKTTGFNSWQEWLKKENAYFSKGPEDYINNFTVLPDDKMQLTVDALRDTVVNASWKMVYAKTDEEFESIWAKMVSDCEGLGAQNVIAWRLADIENARTNQRFFKITDTRETDPFYNG